MKLRMLRTTYAAGQRLADAKGTVFSKWAASAIRKHGAELVEERTPERVKLSRSNSVSVYVDMADYDPKTSRACIEQAIRIASNEPWHYRYDRATLKACITVENYFGRPCDMDRAQELMDARVAQRKAELKARKK